MYRTGVQVQPNRSIASYAEAQRFSFQYLESDVEDVLRAPPPGSRLNPAFWVLISGCMRANLWLH